MRFHSYLDGNKKLTTTTPISNSSLPHATAHSQIVTYHMEVEIEKDIQAIIDYSIEFAEHMLNNGKEYYPFGAQIQNNGELVAVGFKDGESDFPESQNLIGGLKSGFEKLFVDGQIKAYGLTYDVRVAINDSGDKSDAICIDITHRNSIEIPRYYFTYSWNENDELDFGRSFGMEK